MNNCLTAIFLTILLSVPCYSQTEDISTNTEKENPIFPVFNLDDLKPFTPGNNISTIPEKYLPGVDIDIAKTLTIKKYNIVHDAYVFPLFVQHYRGKIIDFYTRLPSYFLHDTFHQSLINRYGKQQAYEKKDSTAVYTWDDQNFKRVYSGGCTVSCFPIYYSEIAKNPGQIPTTYKPLIDHFLDSLNF